MKYLKKFTQFNEDAFATGVVGGMGDVVSAQPGAIAGMTGTTGSGDVSSYLLSKKRKKGNASQVSDARNLAPVKTNKIKD